jgi:hypothetical protein
VPERSQVTKYELERLHEWQIACENGEHEQAEAIMIAYPHLFDDEGEPIW